MDTTTGFYLSGDISQFGSQMIHPVARNVVQKEVKDPEVAVEEDVPPPSVRGRIPRSIAIFAMNLVKVGLLLVLALTI